MIPGGGKAKGAGFERDVCKRLSLWVSGGTKEDCFWRSAMSGGRATVGARKGKDLARQAGDITAVAPEGHSLTDRYYVECKHVRNLQIDRFIVTGTGNLAKFWATAQKEADRYGRVPMIIARQNMLPTILLVGSHSGLADHLIPVVAQVPAHWYMHLFSTVLSHQYVTGLTK